MSHHGRPPAATMAVSGALAGSVAVASLSGASLSGLSQTGPTGSQHRVGPDQRAGVAASPAACSRLRDRARKTSQRRRKCCHKGKF